MSMLKPPELTEAPPNEFVTVAALPEIVLLLIEADSAPPLMWIPAEGTKPKKKSLVTVALLFVTELLLIVKVPPAPAAWSVLTAIPAASAITPCGETAA